MQKTKHRFLNLQPALNLKRWLPVFVVAIIAMAMVGCAGMQSSSTLTPEPVSQTPRYKQTVHFNTENADLQAHLETLLHNHPSLSYSKEASFSTFQVNITPAGRSSSVFSNSPRLLGILKKESEPASHAFRYTISTFNGKTLDEGEVLGTGESRMYFSPSLVKPTTLSPEVLADIAQQLIEIVSRQSRGERWQTAVVGQKDNLHITISAGADEGLKITERFQPLSKPEALLQVVTFEENMFGESRAVLRLEQGFLPTAGRMLVPAELD